ncbi:unnamed protein product [Adineta steineri]|uniref:Uncharacterized protein n=1 Tax=Adineta steineri TaxID=433720 RepID=A0A814MDU9_9BILA|nr:unnamed protein product [Adineta steineri]
MQTLIALDLESNLIGTTGAQYLADGLRNNMVIMILFFIYFIHPSARYCAPTSWIPFWLRLNVTLTTLNLGSNQIGAIGAKHVTDRLRDTTTLTELDLNQNQIGDVGAQYLADALKNNTTLSELDLENNKIEDVGAQYIVDGLQNNMIVFGIEMGNSQCIKSRVNPSVTEITSKPTASSYHKSESESLSSTPNAIAHPPKYRNPTLEECIATEQNESLSLRQRNLTDQDFEIVAYYAIQNNKRFTQLYLGQNQPGDKGTQHIANALRNNTTITILYLDQNQTKIGDKGAQYLADALRHNTALTILYLDQNQIGNDGAQSLADALRNNKCRHRMQDNGRMELVNGVVASGNEQEHHRLRKLFHHTPKN